MRARFTLEYSTGRDVAVDSSVEIFVKYESDKRQFLEAAASMLGIKITVHEGYAEKVFSGDSEQSEELHNED